MAALDDCTTTLNLELTVTGPRLESSGHPTMVASIAGEVEKSAGVGGALALADRAGRSMADVREPVSTSYDQSDAGGPRQ